MFINGEVYYRVTYPDRNMFYPNIEPFVFIGENISDEDDEDTWYFQPARSFAKFGSVLESDQGDRTTSCVTEKDKDDMLDISGLVSELEMASARRNKKSSRQ